MKFFVNENCIGCGLCASTCPEIFSMTEDGVAKASAGPVPAEFCASCQLRWTNAPSAPSSGRTDPAQNKTRAARPALDGGTVFLPGHFSVHLLC